MEGTKYITMPVRWGTQLRQIKININNDMNTIEKAISNTYELQQVNNLDGYQIQYYDSTYEKFVDLCPDTFHLFQQVLNKLTLPDAPPQSAKDWILKLVPKTVQTRRSTTHQSNTDDTYAYQLENDPSESVLPQALLPVADNIPSTSVSSRPRTHISEILPRDPTSLNNNEGQQATARPTVQVPRRGGIQPQLTTVSQHPYDLTFVNRLTKEQRLQYEREVIRLSSSGPKLGGVRLQACPESNYRCYPVVHFNIPDKERQSPWFLHLHVLTEADSNGVHYFHASKIIHNGGTIREERYRTIRTNELPSPSILPLSQKQIRDGAVEIIIKVYNRKDLPNLRNDQLREFPRLNNLKAYDDPTLVSTNTTFSLKFSDENYHLGCSLVCNQIIHDECISSLTAAVPYKKRTKNDQTRQQIGQSRTKKSKISLLLFATTLFALNTTEVFRAPIIVYQKYSQCPSITHFCNTQQNFCISKHSLNSPCQHDYECLTDKCSDQLCRRSCKEDKDCSHIKEYCTISNYCNAKHCGSCLRYVQCANHRCQFFHCASTNCATMLNLLQKHR